MSRYLRPAAVLDGPAGHRDAIGGDPVGREPYDGAPVDDELFRTWFRHQASTVAVVTVAGAPPVGFTATSFTSVSLRPPLVSFCIDQASSSLSAVTRGGHLAVHLLACDQRDVAATFATRGIDRFAAHGAWRTGPCGVPLLDGTLGWLLCRTTELISAGDHTIVLAAALLGASGAADAPLVYHAGAYTRPERT